MKFLLIHQIFLTPQQAGGTRHFEFAKHCTEQGDEIVVLASDVSYLDGKKMDACRVRETVNGIDIHRLRLPEILHRSFFSRLMVFLCFMGKAIFVGMRVSTGVDVVIGTTPPLPQALSALVVATLRRCPFVLEVRDLWPDFAIDIGVLKSKTLIFVARRLELLLYRRAAQIIVNSPAYIDYLVGKGVSPARITLVSNGVAPAMFDPQQKGDDIREQYQLHNKFVVTYAGAIGLANDVETIVSAAELLKDHRNIHFLIVGDGMSRPQIEAIAEELHLTNIAFTGPLKKVLMPDMLAASDVCVAILKNTPMFSMTYPNKVFDYMAAGRPTILAIDGVIRKVIESSRGGVFVSPGDSRALSDAILKLQADPSACCEMGRVARSYVELHFNRKDHARKFREVLLRVAGNVTDRLL